ncbi:drs2 neo1 protein [Coemansia sp. RSA 2424]|nr:drs2 neo1 protein [Coemansia sp. RSA 2424]
MATATVGNNSAYHRALQTEIEWADSVGCATPTTLGMAAFGNSGGNGASRPGIAEEEDEEALPPVRPVVERRVGSSAATTTSLSHEKSSATAMGDVDDNGGKPSVSAGKEAQQPMSTLSTAGSGISLAVVIDGETLATLEEHADEGMLDRFLTLGTLCDAVICSRVSPAQKALIVHNMRVRCEGGGKAHAFGSGKGTAAGAGWWLKRLSRWLRRNPLRDLFTHDNDKYMVTLAIGDGGNDIAMIQEAHVGIGIAGQEGLQASRAADFSIGQFRFLQKLLLVHGRWSYVRVSMFIMGTFYKCMAFYLTQLIFQFYTGFSGTSLFESWTLSMYNTLFSILPVLVVGIFEQDLQPDTLLAYPELYRDMGPRNHLFTLPLFMWRVVFIGLVHAVIAAFFPFAANLALGLHASSSDLYTTGFVVYSIMVLIVTFKIAYIDVRRWVVFSHLSVLLTLAVWFGWNGVLNHVYPRSPGSGYNVLGVFHMLMRQGAFWFEWIIFVAIALCINVLVKAVYSVRDPVEHRIMTWLACERRQESAKHKAERREWFQKQQRQRTWIGRMLGSSTKQVPRSHSE